MLFFIVICIIVLIIICLTLFYFIKSFVYLIKNFKLFKHVFKVQNPIKLKEFAQLIIILFMFILLVVLLTNLFVNSFSMKKVVPCKYAAKKALSKLNQAFLLEIAENGKISYEKEQDVADIFIKRMSVQNAKYIEFQGQKEIYSKKEIKEYNLAKFIGKPIITTTDGMLYMFEEFEQGCNNVDLNNFQNSGCLLVVDINGIKRPNKMTIKSKHIGSYDRFIYIIDGKNNKIITPEMYNKVLKE